MTRENRIIRRGTKILRPYLRLSLQRSTADDCCLSGRCCKSDGSCQNNLSFNDCLADGGVDWTPGTTCEEAPCPVQACCFPNGTCQDLFCAECVSQGGTCMGSNTQCEDNLCPGACCRPNYLGCVQTTQQQCSDMGGYFVGHGWPCDPNPCPPQPDCHLCADKPNPGDPASYPGYLIQSFRIEQFADPQSNCPCWLYCRPYTQCPADVLCTTKVLIDFGVRQLILPFDYCFGGSPLYAIRSVQFGESYYYDECSPGISCVAHESPERLYCAEGDAQLVAGSPASLSHRLRTKTCNSSAYRQTIQGAGYLTPFNSCWDVNLTTTKTFSNFGAFCEFFPTMLHTYAPGGNGGGFRMTVLPDGREVRLPVPATQALGNRSSLIQTRGKGSQIIVPQMNAPKSSGGCSGCGSRGKRIVDAWPDIL